MSGVVAFEFDGCMHFVDFFDELFEGLFPVCPDQKDVVLESDIGAVAVCYSWVNVCCLKMAHE